MPTLPAPPIRVACMPAPPPLPPASAPATRARHAFPNTHGRSTKERERTGVSAAVPGIASSGRQAWRFLAHDCPARVHSRPPPPRNLACAAPSQRPSNSVLAPCVLRRNRSHGPPAAPRLPFAPPRRARRLPCYTPVRAAPPSSRGLGHDPFKVEIRGSNPLGGTPIVFRRVALPAASTQRAAAR